MSVLSLRFISNLFSSPNTQQIEAESSDRVRKIVEKLVHHIDLSPQDEAFLESSAQSTQGWGKYALSFIVTLSDQKTCEVINALSREVLNGNLTAEDALARVSTLVESSPYLSDGESKGNMSLASIF